MTRKATTEATVHKAQEYAIVSDDQLSRMFGRGSPRMNLIQAATMKKISPRSTANKRKKRTSPKGNIAEGTMNFTSIEPSRPPVTQPCQDDELRVFDPPAPASLSKRAKNVGTGNSRTRINKRTQDGNVVEMMGGFLEMKEKQAEADERATTNANEDDFPIQTCIAIMDGMEEFSDDEKVDAYDVFKDAQNRAIFMTAKDATRIKWLRKKIART
ncbi:OSJNBa0089K21.9-like protein [Zea mays]|uniref:OSJNBa0089K21.9-like protein n=1 Tax=Zea mays TaxID=4577 RepID=A0A1D6PVW6_MAIZE|nr:OSJNBa0089K21.9-like protein [Zea mays]